MIVTGCVIAGNEKYTIEKCLKSLIPIVDRMIFVDTGSTDGTLEIAKSYNIDIKSFRWNDNFSDARNYALDCVSGDWIVFLDADEQIVTNAFKFRQILKKEKADVLICALKNVNELYYTGSVARVFKCSKDIRFKRSIHEYLFKKNGILDTSDYRTEISILHYGYTLDAIRRNNKYERNISLLLKELLKSPMDGELNFYIADFYRSGSEWVKAMFHLDIALDADCFRLPEFFMLTRVLKAIIMLESGIYNAQVMYEYINYCMNSIAKRPEFPACKAIILARGGCKKEAEKNLQLSMDFLDLQSYGLGCYTDIIEDAKKEVYKII